MKHNVGPFWGGVLDSSVRAEWRRLDLGQNARVIGLSLFASDPDLKPRVQEPLLYWKGASSK